MLLQSTNDLVIVGVFGVVALFFFFAFLMIRRTVLAFREGSERGRNR